jgi:hypothetical protein
MWQNTVCLHFGAHCLICLAFFGIVVIGTCLVTQLQLIEVTLDSFLSFCQIICRCPKNLEEEASTWLQRVANSNEVIKLQLQSYKRYYLLSIFVSIPLSLSLAWIQGTSSSGKPLSSSDGSGSSSDRWPKDVLVLLNGKLRSNPSGRNMHASNRNRHLTQHTHCSKDVAETWQNWFTEMDPLNWSFSVAISRSSTLIFTVYRGLKYFDPCPGDRNMLMLTNKKPRLI